MKILFTNQFKGNGGGHTTYIVNLVRELSLTHECHVACPESSRLYRFVEEIAAQQKDSLHGANLRAIPQLFHSRLPLMWGEVRQLRALLKRERYDIVHANGSGDHRHLVLACLGLKHKPKLVFTKHNDHKLKSLGNRLRASGTDRIIAVSQYIKSLFTDTPYENIPIDVVYHGVDTEYFTPTLDLAQRELVREQLVGPQHKDLILLGSTGGTDIEKGWLEMVEAIALLPQELCQRCRVIMAGDTPEDSRLERVYAAGMQDQVIFPGLLDDVRPMLQACDLGFVLSHKEALSFACRESMAMGLPTIVTNVGGLPENIQDQVDGWIVPVKDPSALSQLLVTLLNDQALCKKVGQAARKTAENQFNLSLFARNTLLCYDKVLQKV